ncbi:HK97-gp10 family putative phage morphogenesis protein [Arsenicicoccus dermatophilus]|uniref:HK97-gp10 family putative phage morphogenesis protein n=1 Tax=Arsenicicoccus dermatophilus TaxID=1076331 RepID=UPI001F4D266C|nr:HK97-gp10 family putative phage morphogenesis protein [Arsenicicoccus dermatophilus]MCH8613469.1 HK97 gp10 family phage protein [Arsenicicoccus dermatophilus]
MPTISIDTGDLAATAARLKAAGPRARQANTAAVRAATMHCERTARSLAPVDTGLLRGSIHGSTTGGAASTGTVTSGASYGVYVEYGTARMAPRPHMRPAGVAAGLMLARAVEQIPRIALS